MKKQKMRIDILIFCILALLLGVVFLGAAIDELKFENNAVGTVGTIKSIEQYRKSGEDTDRHRVAISYIVDGTEYEGVTNEWNEQTHVGQEISGFYDKTNPADFRMGMPSESVARVIIAASLSFILMAVVFFRAERSAAQILSPMLIGCVVFFVVGVISFTIGLEVYKSNKDFKKTAVQAEAVISDIDEEHHVAVSLTVDGKDYRDEIGEWDGEMYVGKPIDIFYDPENPEDIRTCNPILPKVLIAMGSVFLLIASVAPMTSLLRFIALSSGRKRAENGLFTPKEEVLREASAALNRKGQPWEVVVRGDTIEANWKWKAVSTGVTKARMKENMFVFAVVLNDYGVWWEELDVVGTTKNSRGSRESFVGKTYQKSLAFSIDKDSDTGKRKIKKDAEMDTASIKRDVREYLKENGWRKAGLSIKPHLRCRS